jgi:hypothetical protein
MREISFVFIVFLYLERMIIMKTTSIFTNVIDLAKAVETWNRHGIEYHLVTCEGIAGEELIMAICTVPEEGMPWMEKLEAYDKSMVR